MACTFTVTSVVPTLSGGQITALDVQGTAHFTPPNTCTTVDIRITCGPAVVLSGSAPISSSGLWSHHFAPVPHALLQCCDNNVTVTVSCSGGGVACPAQQFQVPMHCKCPSLGAIVCNAEPCRPDGTVLLTFTGHLLSLGTNTSVTLQWTFDGNNIGTSSVWTSPGNPSGNLVVPGDGLSHTLALTIVSPAGCPPVQVVVQLPDCSVPKCPTLGAIVCNAEPCRPDGTVLLTFTGHLLSLGTNTSVTLQWTFDGNNIGTSSVWTSPGNPSGNLVVPGDGLSHTLALTIVSPAGCPPVQVVVQLPNCSVPKCPTLGAIVCNPEPCRPDGTVLLTFTGHLLSLGTNTSVTLQWTFDGNNIGTSSVWTSPGNPSGNLVVPGDGLSHTLALTIVSPAGCPPVQVVVQLPNCVAPCPKINIHAVVGDCNAQGTRPVTITATLTGSSASTPVTGTMTTPCGSASNSGVGTLTLTKACILGPGTYTVTVYSGDCPPKTYTFTVEDCCPDIKIKYDVGECNKDGTRPVTITAVVTAANGSTQISGQLMGPCGTVPISGTGSVTVTSSCNLNTGSYLVTVTAVGCKNPKTETIDVQDCCPTVDFRHEVCGWPICNDKGTRPVTIWATVNPHPGVSTTASLVDTASGNVLDSGSGSTPFTLTATQDYPDGTNQVQVTFAAPLKCPPQTYSFCVPKCETLKCFVVRNIIVAALSTFLAITMMKISGYLASSFPAGLWFLAARSLDFVGNASVQSWLTAMQLLALGVAIITFVYWWLCLRIFGWTIGGCCYTCCMLRLVLWQTFLIVGLILLWFLAVSWLLNLLFALIFLIIGYLLFLWWKATCCPGKCDPKFYLMWTFALAIGQAIVAVDFAGVTSQCVWWSSITIYPRLFTFILWLVTMVLRFIIGLLLAYFILAWGCCFATCGRVAPTGRMPSVPEPTRAMKCCGQ